MSSFEEGEYVMCTLGIGRQGELGPFCVNRGQEKLFLAFRSVCYLWPAPLGRGLYIGGQGS